MLFNSAHTEVCPHCTWYAPQSKAFCRFLVSLLVIVVTMKQMSDPISRNALHAFVSIRRGGGCVFQILLVTEDLSEIMRLKRGRSQTFVVHNWGLIKVHGKTQSSSTSLSKAGSESKLSQQATDKLYTWCTQTAARHANWKFAQVPFCSSFIRNSSLVSLSSH